VICLFDAGFLHILFDEKARVPRDPKGKPIIDRAQDRIDFLVQTIGERRDNKIILPTPALTEFMLLAEDRYADYLTIIRRRSIFEISGFDDPESVELVEHWRKFGDHRKKLRMGTPETWAKMKYDRQIAAIAVTRRVDRIYSTDSDLKKYADELQIKYVGLTNLPLPPTSQVPLPFDEESEQTDHPSSTVETGDQAQAGAGNDSTEDKSNQPDQADAKKEQK